MKLRACIPQPLQIVIDDVGWRTGRNGSADNEPYRTGMPRDHVAADYAAIVAFGRALGMRPQAAMILSEWDTTNRLRSIPTASWMGAAWDNGPRVGAWIEECANVVRDGRDGMELVLHGLGHEYWPAPGVRFERAEWHDAAGTMRPEGELRARLDFFFDLVTEHRLGAGPRAFVPCAFCHRFGDAERNLARILAEYGIASISTAFVCLHRSRPTEHGRFGFDEGVITVSRWGGYPYDLYDPPELVEPDGPVLGLHWPQLLHLDPTRNGEVVDRWVALLEPWGRRFGNMLAPSTDGFLVQLVAHDLATLAVDGDAVRIDARAVFAQPWRGRPDEPIVVQIQGLPRCATVVDERGEAVPQRGHTGADGDIASVELPLSAQRPQITLRVRTPQQ